ncbi:hypothetical protein [Chitinophaga eiseniae]|uniref:Uncharacterized protein n=1 Tax=Chitinophaga eiseniae TaxID=634771 RepID=A0A847SGJ9_9BACT|nr:hypothetical protein [Chitinophaga eiseniae]NLR80941.1 hypothetical protein [Chitinophaga eiseniae]
MRRLFIWMVMMGIAVNAGAQHITIVTGGKPENSPVARVFGKDKFTLVSGYLHITPEEAIAFEAAWSDYERDKRSWLSECYALLTMYHDVNALPDNARADMLNRQLISNDLAYVRLQMKHSPAMNELLGATRASLFFQLDSHIEQAGRVYIQQQLPFTRQPEPLPGMPPYFLK